MDFDVAFLVSTFVKLVAAVPMTLGLFACSVSLGALFALGITYCRVSGGLGSKPNQSID